ncbi:MAG TPA: hypothetical protein VM487_09680, partial [Phycisphaerae bacterium]|nr:hypothetical protein [Phycisphaerae bacterium]
IGPGIVVNTCDAAGTHGTTAWNAVADPASGDFIARSGEFSTSTTGYKNFHGIPDFFNPAMNLYRNAAGTLLDRDADGNRWMLPFVYTAATAGSEVAFDLRSHIRPLEDVLGRAIKTGRNARRQSPQEGVSISDAMVGIAGPEIINDVVDEAINSINFTATQSTSMDAATRQRLFGNVGFEGIVYHSPTLGSIALEADPACRPYVVELLEPNSFFWMYFADGRPGRPRWTGDWDRVQSTTLTGGTYGTPTFYRQKGYWCAMLLVCDQLMANAEIQGVKSSRQ